MGPAGADGADGSAGPPGADGTLNDYFDVTEYGAVGDGITDDRLAIQAAIEAANAAGGGTVYVPAGTYIVSENGSNFYCLLLRANVHLRGASQGASVLKQVAGIALSVRLLYVDTDDVLITDITLDGDQAAQSVSEHRHGIIATTCERLKVERVTSQNFTGDGFYLSTGSRDASFFAVRATGNNRNGITLGSDVAGVYIGADSHFVGNAVQQVDSEPGGETTVTDVRVEGCFLDGAGVSTDYALVCAGTGSSTRGRGWTITGNVIRGTTHIGWCDDVLFTGNVVENPTNSPCVSVYRACSRIGIYGNKLALTSTTVTSEAIVRIQATSSANQPDGVEVVGNEMTCAYAGNAAVLIHGANHVNIANNRMSGVGSAVSTNGGVLIRATVSGRSITCVGNTIRNFGTVGVKVYRDSVDPLVYEHIDISHNVLEDNQGVATMVTGVSLDFDGVDVASRFTCIGNTSIGGVTTPVADWPPNTPVLIGGTRGAGGIYSVTGTPEGAVTEVVGAMAYDRAGGAGTTAYLKESGTGNTGWVAI